MNYIHIVKETGFDEYYYNELVKAVNEQKDSKDQYELLYILLQYIGKFTTLNILNKNHLKNIGNTILKNYDDGIISLYQLIQINDIIEKIQR